MTVQELIDALQNIEDKEKPVVFISEQDIDNERIVIDVADSLVEVILYDY